MRRIPTCMFLGASLFIYLFSCFDIANAEGAKIVYYESKECIAKTHMLEIYP
jgi:hypothetical protein